MNMHAIVPDTGEVVALGSALVSAVCCTRRSFPAVCKRPASPRGVVYWVCVNGDTCLYVGQTALDVRDRLLQHRNSHSDFGQALVGENSARVFWTSQIKDRHQRLLIERNLIRYMEPVFNVAC